jgi:hypothetical protein
MCSCRSGGDVLVDHGYLALAKWGEVVTTVLRADLLLLWDLVEDLAGGETKTKRWPE